MDIKHGLLKRGGGELKYLSTVATSRNDTTNSNVLLPPPYDEGEEMNY